MENTKYRARVDNNIMLYKALEVPYQRTPTQIKYLLNTKSG